MTIGKWPQKQENSQDAGEKKIVAPYKKFNTIAKGDGPHPRE